MLVFNFLFKNKNIHDSTKIENDSVTMIMTSDLVSNFENFVIQVPCAKQVKNGFYLPITVDRNVKEIVKKKSFSVFPPTMCPNCLSKCYVYFFGPLY